MSEQLISDESERTRLALLSILEDERLTREELQASEGRFRAFVTASSDVVYRMSADWTEMYFLDGRDFIADTLSSDSTWLDRYIHPLDQSRVWEAIQEAIRTKSIFALEHRVIRVDGSLGWTFSRAIPILDDHGDIVEWFGAAQDITARKEAEEKLRTTQEKFSKTFRLSPDIIILTSLKDGLVVDANENAFLVTGHGPDGFIGKKTTELEIWVDPEARDRYISGLGQEGSVHNFETRFRMKSGEIRTGLISGEIIEIGGEKYILGVIRDITERKQAQKMLADTEERLRLSTAAGNVGLWDWDLVTNQVYYSPEWKRQIGYEVNEIRDDYTEWETRIHTEDLDRVVNYVKAYIREQTAPFEQEFRFRHKDGSYRWILARADMIRNADGRPVRLLGSHIDITGQKRMEESVRKKTRDLSALLEISQNLSSTLNREILLQRIVDHAVTLGGLNTGAIYLIRDKELILSATTPPLPADFPEIARRTLLNDHPHIMQTLLSGRPLYFSDVESESFAPAEATIIHARGLKSILYIPIRIEKKAKGILILGTLETTRFFSEAELDLYTTLANQSAFVLFNAELFEDSKRYTAELEQHITQREKAEELLRTTMNRLIEAEEQLRRDAAQQLHDQVGQNLTALTINLNFLRNKMSGLSNEDEEKRLTDSLLLLDDTIDRIRDVMTDLRPSILDDYGLYAALSWSTKKFTERTHIPVKLVGRDATKRPPLSVEYALFRISQEALHNILKHAHAGHVTCELTQARGLVKLSIQDDGVGFNPQKVWRGRDKGLGLINIAERMKALGGEFEVQSNPGKGTHILLRIKYNKR